MRNIITFLFCLLEMSGFAANPAFQDFDTTQFSTTGNKVSGKTGILFTNVTIMGNTNLSWHALTISADNPINSPTTIGEQVVIQNTNRGVFSQSMIGFSVWNGHTQSTLGWVGATAGTFSPGTLGNSNTMYMESSEGPLEVIAGNTTNGYIDFITGGYNDVTKLRMRIDPTGPIHMMSSLSITGAVTHASDSGVGGGLSMILQSENGNPALSYQPINFYVPTSGLIGQFESTANNYFNAGAPNLSSNSILLLAEATAGNLILGAGGASGAVAFLAGGYGVASERMRIATTGTGFGTTTPSQKLDVVGTVKSGGTNSTTPGFKATGTNAIVLTDVVSGTYILQSSNGVLVLVTNTGGLVP